MSLDNRPIGVFDSGLGGLTVVKEIQQRLPRESILYVGDTARVPYGNRSKESITRFSREIVRFLLEHNVKAIVIACGTASSVAATELRDEFSQIPMFDMIQPFTQWKLNQANGRIGITGTRATIHAGKLKSAILTTNPSANVVDQPCPLWVPIIEEGISSGIILEDTISLYLKPWQAQTPDYVVLGCTHYPIIANAIQSFLPTAQIIQPGRLLADMLDESISHGNFPAADLEQVTHRYCVTDLNENFQNMAEIFLGRELTVEKITLPQSL